MFCSPVNTIPSSVRFTDSELPRARVAAWVLCGRVLSEFLAGQILNFLQHSITRLKEKYKNVHFAVGKGTETFGLLLLNFFAR